MVGMLLDFELKQLFQDDEHGLSFIGIYPPSRTSHRRSCSASTVAGAEVETFLNINNVLNRDPGMIPRGADEIGYELPTTNLGKYDTLGRVFRAGVRFRM